MSFRDRSSAGRSELIPFKAGEDAPDRHARRLSTNLGSREEMAAALQALGYTLQVKNDGHHWVMARAKDLWEWWPSSAKLVRNKQFRKGKHCHDFQQVLRVITGGA